MIGAPTIFVSRITRNSSCSHSLYPSICHDLWAVPWRLIVWVIDGSLAPVCHRSDSFERESASRGAGIQRGIIELSQKSSSSSATFAVMRLEKIFDLSSLHLRAILGDSLGLTWSFLQLRAGVPIQQQRIESNEPNSSFTVIATIKTRWGTT